MAKALEISFKAYEGLHKENVMYVAKRITMMADGMLIRSCLLFSTQHVLY
jgi:hypothetical protein